MTEYWMPFTHWILHTALAGGLLLLLVCLGMRWIRQPAKKQRLGELGMAVTMLVALLTLSGRPLFIVSWSLLQAEQNPRLATNTKTDADSANQDGVDAVTYMPTSAPAHASDAAAPSGGSELEVPAEGSFHWAVPASAIVVFSFLLIACYLAIRLALAYLSLLRLLVSSREAPEPIRNIFTAMAGDNARARLRVTPRLPLPVSCGLVRPTVLLPSSQCDQPVLWKLRWIFAHELTHLRRRDAWSSLLFSVGQVLFFYLPWFWWLKRQVRLCQEFVADAVATAEEGQAVQYAEFLVSLVDARPSPVGATGVGGNNSDLFRRVSMLLDRPMVVEPRCTRRWTFFAGLAVLAVGTLLAAVGYRAEAGPDDTIVIIIRPDRGNAQPSLKTDPKVGSDKNAPESSKASWNANTLQLGTFNDATLLEGLFRPWNGADGAWQTSVQGHALQNLVNQNPDVLEPLRQAIKKLETLHNNGQLSKEMMRAEIEKAVTQAVKQLLEQGGQPQAGAHRLLIGNNADIPIALNAMTPSKAQTLIYRIYSGNPKDLVNPIGPGTPSQPDGKPRFGVSVAPVPETVAEYLALPKNTGMVVQQVIPETPAARLGIQVRDILLKIGGAPISSSSEEFVSLIAKLKANTPLDVVVIRKGHELKLGKLELPPVFVPDEAAKLLAKQDELASEADRKIISVYNGLTRAATPTPRLVISQKLGDANITLTGILKGGGLEISDIAIQKGNTTTSYKTVHEVPEEYRSTVSGILERLRASADRPSATPPASKQSSYLDHAERNFGVAQFYERTGHPESARFFYEMVKRHYPGTEFATRAEKCIVELIS